MEKLLLALSYRKVNLELLARSLLPKPPAGCYFSEAERRTFIALAEVLLEGAPVKVPASEVADNIELMLLRGRSRRGWRVRVLYNLIELAPVLLLGRKPFSRLSFPERKAVVEEHFGRGNYLWRLCAKGRHLIHLGCYADDRANAPVGFVPIAERERYARRKTAT